MPSSQAPRSSGITSRANERKSRCSPPRLKKRAASAPSSSTEKWKTAPGTRSAIVCSRCSAARRAAEVALDGVGHLVEVGRQLLELRHALLRRALAPVALRDPLGHGGEARERAGDPARRQDEQRRGDRRQRDQRQRLQHEQAVRAVRERVAALGGARVDQPREALDRGHDRALLRVVGVVDETVVVTGAHHLAFGARERVGGGERRVERRELLRREARLAHQRLQAAGRAGALPGGPGEHAVPVGGVVVDRPRRLAAPDGEDLVVVAAVALLARGDVQADHAREVVRALAHLVGEGEARHAVVLGVRALGGGLRLQDGDAEQRRGERHREREQRAEQPPDGHGV